MKAVIRYYWHMYRAGYYWSKVICKIDRTGLTAKHLITINPSFKRDCANYYHSLGQLVLTGKYITANSLIVRKRNDYSDLTTGHSRSD